ncbi:putative inositol transporter 2 [Apostasia shenzhenica]|uniref:Putative inositol transporter 2 n=1 Tax=Apostasia shenzhenica TaxID=1088818 RepID=A0A2I0A987_9ASPA|nr:putative inositol transporter 2 [Apostasia shenzhenica]
MNRKEEAEAILRKIYPADEIQMELELLRQSVESEVAQEGAIGDTNIFGKVKKAWSTRIVRRGLVAGIVCQVAQQFCGINTVMYYAPSIVQLAGYASNSTALALSLITSGLNAIGSIVSMYFVDRSGRRRLMIFSLCGIILWLGVLSGVFYAAAVKSPAVGLTETQHFGNYTCPAYNPAKMKYWKCIDCLKAECSFCANGDNKLLAGACMANPQANGPIKHACQGEHRYWYTQGCPSDFGWIALVALALYIIFYSPGMGTAPWIVNSEIYPLRFRGICGGMAAVANWVSNLIVTQTFLTLTKAIGTANTFILFGIYSIVALVLIFFIVPETKGLPFEEVEVMLSAEDYKPWKARPVQTEQKLQNA